MDQLFSIVQFGSIGPLQPKSSKLTITLLVITCCVFAVVCKFISSSGYDVPRLDDLAQD